MLNQVELLDLLLNNRGILPSEKEHFLNPSYDNHIYDPYLLRDMEKSCNRIYDAIKNQEKIVVYTDYDCDGIPAGVIMHDFFTKIGYENFSIYIPDRHDEGYGLHLDAIEDFIKNDVKLLITFDLGITAVDEVAFAQNAGMDVIITDHHLPQDEIPKAFAIINPKLEFDTKHNRNPDKMPARLDDPSRSGGLCGAGIAFKLVCGMLKTYPNEWNIQKGWEKWLLDMAGLATLADQVPLVNENRVLAYYGLKVLQKSRRPGLVELFRKAGVDITKLNEEDVTFTLAPRLNAASRMGSPRQAFEVLSTTDSVEARTVADYLSKINNERKSNVALIMKEVKHTLNKREEKSIIVIGNPSWRVGVLGLVASKVAEEYKRSVFVWGSEGSDTIRGSCRGWGSVNLVSLMSSLPEHSLLSFGGHKSAGGFSVSHEEVHFLEERLIGVFDTVDSLQESQEQEIDATITLDDITKENYSVIEKLAPYGIGNPKPSFLFEKITVHEIKEFGKEKNHLEIIFLNSKNRPVKAIAFFKTRDSFCTGVGLTEGMKINLTANFEKSTFAGRTELRLRIIDVSIAV